MRAETSTKQELAAFTAIFTGSAAPENKPAIITTAARQKGCFYTALSPARLKIKERP
ncbi:hypothetical protein [Paraburkholderia sp. UCT31]|uniref:hypothetical protein n=1 Tax=Paraburkholderia sp. UCT31 TaxID=2615209 RepID=UPI001654C2DD|nr:hypothetical protein [Paraburkholderia sp. UCT31]